MQSGLLCGRFLVGDYGYDWNGLLDDNEEAEHRFAELRAEVYRMIKKPVAGPGAPVAVDQANGH